MLHRVLNIPLLVLDATGNELISATKIWAYSLDTGCKLNVNKTFRRRPGSFLKVLYTFNLRSVHRGSPVWLSLSHKLVESKIILDCTLKSTTINLRKNRKSRKASYMKRLLQGLRSKEAKGAIVSPINIFADQFLSIFSPIFKCFVKNMSYIIYSKLCLRISKFVTIISCFQIKYCYLELLNFFHYLVAVLPMSIVQYYHYYYYYFFP